MLVYLLHIATLIVVPTLGTISSRPVPLLAQEAPEPQVSGAQNLVPQGRHVLGSRSPLAIQRPEASAWVETTTKAFEPIAPSQERRLSGRPLAMMAGGGAALVAGLVVGGDAGFLVASAGGLVALVGIYRYLR